MLYWIEYVRDGKQHTAHGSRAECQALADYLMSTYRIKSTISRSKSVLADLEEAAR
jgi:hypothetical protein